MKIEYPQHNMSAGAAAATLIAEPATWINRRVETIELLSHEETRRQVSVDFTLSNGKRQELVTEHGVVVPISVMTKEPRRNFDVRDESGSAVPVLGKGSNAGLAHLAAMSSALNAVASSVRAEEFDPIASELRELVVLEPEDAEEVLSSFVAQADAGDPLRSSIWADSSCRSLFAALQNNYVLFAVISSECPERRILKYSYGEDFDRQRKGSLSERLDLSALAERVSRPGRHEFELLCPEAWRAKSFHLEVVVPEELRIETAFLYDFRKEELLSSPDRNRNRASLYADRPVSPEISVDAYVVLTPERRGNTTQAAMTAAAVTGLIWLGVASGLDFSDPDASVSIVVAGAALYSGMTAARGESSLVSQVFSTPRFLLGWVSLSALAASASLAMEIPDPRPTTVWLVAAIVSSLASLWLIWSAVRGPS
jgi:hypothetical protein